MKKLISAVGLVAISAFARGDTQLPPPAVVNILTPVDIVPTQQQLTQVLGTPPEALDKLTLIASTATDPEHPEYTGMRLRAIHALEKYCPLPGQPGTPACNSTDPGWPAHQALAAIVANQPLQVHGGSDLVVLRAAIESLGPLRVSSDVTILAPILEHSSRDIRAATARSLRDLCNASAGNALRARQQHEPTEQVQLAIADALRVLATCP